MGTPVCSGTVGTVKKKHTEHKNIPLGLKDITGPTEWRMFG